MVFSCVFFGACCWVVGGRFLYGPVWKLGGGGVLFLILSVLGCEFPPTDFAYMVAFILVALFVEDFLIRYGSMGVFSVGSFFRKVHVGSDGCFP